MKSVYDYARIASAMLTSYEDSLSKIESKFGKKGICQNVTSLFEKRI